jgi:hypothetical protein
MRSIVTEGALRLLNDAPSVTARIRAAPPPPRCG